MDGEGGEGGGGGRERVREREREGERGRESVKKRGTEQLCGGFFHRLPEV